MGVCEMETKDILNMIAIFMLIGVLIGVAVQNQIVTNRYNELAEEYNNLSNSCIPVITVSPGVLDRPDPNFTQILEDIR